MRVCDRTIEGEDKRLWPHLAPRAVKAGPRIDAAAQIGSIAARPAHPIFAARSSGGLLVAAIARPPRSICKNLLRRTPHEQYYAIKLGGDTAIPFIVR